MGESISKLERSLKSLREAIKGEYNAIKKYKLYKKIAEDEGYHNIAKLFKGLIAGENIHLKNHRNALKSILKEDYKSEPKVEEPDLKDFHNNTIMNVKDAIKGETWEYNEMY
ncbi:MAG: ferritin family protein, partial [Promethearchaeota archaeon]